MHLTLALPYETSGGVFEVAAHLKDSATVVAFQARTQSRILPYISSNRSVNLPANFCDALPSTSDAPTLWVVREDVIATCPLLDSVPEISRFQVDRTRAKWVLLDMTSIPSTK